MPYPGNTKGGSIIVPLTSCLTAFDYSVLQIKTKIVSCLTAVSKPVKQEVNGTVIHPPLVFPALLFSLASDRLQRLRDHWSKHFNRDSGKNSERTNHCWKLRRLNRPIIQAEKNRL